MSLKAENLLAVMNSRSEMTAANVQMHSESEERTKLEQTVNFAALKVVKNLPAHHLRTPTYLPLLGLTIMFTSTTSTLPVTLSRRGHAIFGGVTTAPWFNPMLGRETQSFLVLSHFLKESRRARAGRRAS